MKKNENPPPIVLFFATKLSKSWQKGFGEAALTLFSRQGQLDAPQNWRCKTKSCDEQRKSLQHHRRGKNLCNIAPVDYFMLANNGRILDVNITGADLKGLTKSLLIWKPFSACILGDKAELGKLKDCTEACFREGGKKTCDLRRKKPDGTTFFV